LRLEKAGAKILGHSSESIDNAENRIKFSHLLHSLEIDQPAWAELTNLESGISFASKVGYPVVCRPSYVLSGAAMRLVNSEDELKQMLISSTDVSPEHPVAISKF
jgi:carbamoyl-phosphate synthase large subunit